MQQGKFDISEFHWLMDMLQGIDVGLIVLDRNFNIQLWNSFMSNYSGKDSTRVIGENLFSLFKEIPESWFRNKVSPVFQLKSRTFTSWEQRPYLFRLRNYRPITGTAEFMYQDVSFVPLVSSNGEVEHIGLIVNDVTDVAVNKLALQDANVQLEQLSQTDRLTGLFNRGHWEELVVQEFKRVTRTGHPCSMIMFDIDHFKKINDNYGHPAGDEVIRQTAAILRDCIRETDVGGRYGGEEFGVLLINTEAEDARVVAERIRESIEALTVTHEAHVIRYTVSLGIAEMSGSMDNHEQLIHQADQALYQSKEGGRNQATVFKG
jgi:diguanylate cyclase (GGDEF)-like protein